MNIFSATICKWFNSSSNEQDSDSAYASGHTAEGGTPLWSHEKRARQQKIIGSVIPQDYYTKPLDRPPEGKIWQQTHDGSWLLVSLPTGTAEHKASSPVDLSNDKINESIVEHTVLSSDTIQGICLKYRITATILRRHNFFSGNNIQGLAVLRIPVNPNAPPIEIQINSNEAKLQRFKNATGETGREAKIYLDEAGWDVDRAIDFWKCDESWTARNTLEDKHLPSVDIEDVEDDDEQLPTIGKYCNSCPTKKNINQRRLSQLLHSSPQRKETPEIHSTKSDSSVTETVVTIPKAIIFPVECESADYVQISSAVKNISYYEDREDTLDGLELRLHQQRLEEMAQEPLVS